MLQRALALTRQGKVGQATRLIQEALGVAGSDDSVVTPTAPRSRTIRAQATVKAVSPAAPTEDASAAREQRARSERGVHRHGSRELPYEVFVPASFVAGEGALVVMLHGCKQTPADFAQGTTVNLAAERYGCVVLYPEQTTRANATRCWNWFDAAHQRAGAGEPAAIASLVTAIAQAHGTAPGRTFVAGLSAGGAMAAILGAVHPESFAAIGVHSGIAPGIATDLPSAFAAMAGRAGPASPEVSLARAQRLVVFHGDRDTTVAPANLDHLARDFLAGRSLTASRVAGEAGGRSYDRTIHRDGAGRALLETWLVHGLAHAWSGGDARGSYADAAGPDATAEMLRFFHEG